MPNKNTTTTDQLWQSYQALGSLRAVADRHRFVSVGAVWKRLTDAGHTLNPPGIQGSSRRISDDDLQVMYFRLGSYGAVAEEIGSTYNAVRMRLMRASRARQ